MKINHIRGYGIVSMGLVLFCVAWVVLYMQGKRFALRDRLQKADAIVVLSGTRGNKRFLEGKIETAFHLYTQGWASYIIGSGKFSMKIDEHAQLISLAELQQAVAQGRLQEKDLPIAREKWDTRLGATYIRDVAIQRGVPSEAILTERESLHTRESAEYVLRMLKQYGMKRIILVTSPFHQLRLYLTFAKVLQPEGIEIANYYASSDDWRPWTWFLSKRHRELVRGEWKRIRVYRRKGDLA